MHDVAIMHQAAQHDWLQQLCLMNILVPVQKYANDTKIAAVHK